jgi:hypothetical protein
MQTGPEHPGKYVMNQPAGLTARFSFVDENLIDFPVTGGDP